MASWMDYMMNPRGHHVKKAMFEVMQERYAQNENIIERISASLVTEADTKAFFKLVSDIYEKAYLKAVADHQEQLRKAGLVAKIVTSSEAS